MSEYHSLSATTGPDRNAPESYHCVTFAFGLRFGFAAFTDAGTFESSCVFSASEKLFVFTHCGRVPLYVMPP